MTWLIILWHTANSAEGDLGVRAQIINKGKTKPKWIHSSYEEVTEEELDSYFAMLPIEDELPNTQKHSEKPE